MNTQQQEAQDYEASYDRFEGFDRGDQNFDYAAAQQAENEADEAEMNADIAAGNGHLWGL